jgi:hypothetical protein
MSTNDAFRIEWDLHELGSKQATEPLAERPIYRDLSAQLDFSRLDYARALAAGYVPANQRDVHEDEAA